MALPRALLVTSVIALPPAYYAYTTISRLEAKYPPQPPESSSTVALRTPSDPNTHHTPHIDIYAAKVPVSALRRKSSSSLEEAWAKAFFESPALRMEGKAAGAFSSGPGYSGEQGFSESQTLLNGVWAVVRPPAPSTPLLVQWTFPPAAVSFVRRAAAWGYPWRFMRGGKQELSVGEVGDDGLVEVRFASAQEYEWVQEEGNNQKTIPGWTSRLHKAYAMWLLDERVEALRRAANDAIAEPHDSEKSGR